MKYLSEQWTKVGIEKVCGGCNCGGKLVIEKPFSKITVI
jgi:hypothetical protein